MIFLGANYITMLARLHILTIHVRQDNLCHINAIHLARGLNTTQLSTTLSLGRTSILVNFNRYIFYDAWPAIRVWLVQHTVQIVAALARSNLILWA